MKTVVAEVNNSIESYATIASVLSKKKPEETNCKIRLLIYDSKIDDDFITKYANSVISPIDEYTLEKMAMFEEAFEVLLSIELDGAEDDDVITLQYATVLMNHYHNIQLYIRPDHDYTTYYKASHFFVSVLQSRDFKNRMYGSWRKEGAIYHTHLSPRIDEKIFTKFSPVIHLSRDYIDVKNEKSIPWGGDIERFRKRENTQEVWIFDQFRSLFEHNDERRAAFYKSDEFNTSTKNLSVLAFYMLCFIYYYRTEFCF